MNKQIPYFLLAVVSNYIKDKDTFVNLMCVNKRFKKLNKWYNGEHSKIVPGFIHPKLFTKEYEYPLIKYKTIGIDASGEIISSTEIEIFKNCYNYIFRESEDINTISELIRDLNFKEDIQINIELTQKICELPTDIFYNCFRLGSIVIPSTITKINQRAFTCCYRLENIKIPSSVVYIGDKAFAFCLSLKEIEIPSSVTHIGDGAFNGCFKLTNIKLSEKLSEVKPRMFADCKNLEEITLPDSMTRIDDFAFKNCSKLKLVRFSSNLRYIAMTAFEDCNF